MRQSKLLLFFVVLMSMNSYKSFAYDIAVDGFYYNILSDNTLEVTYKEISGYINKSSYSGTMTIPSIVHYNGVSYNVSSIGHEAFAYCSKLSSIIIAHSITTISDRAFAFCNALSSVSMSNNTKSIGKLAFAECYKLESIQIPDNTTYIGAQAFSGCHSLKEVTLPSLISKIEGSSFSYCSSLEEITIPNNVYEIGYSAFQGCEKLKYIIIPDKIQEISTNTFEGCRELKTIVLGNSVGDIATYAFSNCPNLKEIYTTNPQPSSRSRWMDREQFDDNCYKNAVLYVPQGSKNNYTIHCWGHFNNVKEYDTSIINSVINKLKGNNSDTDSNQETVGTTVELNGIKYRITSNSGCEVISGGNYSGNITIPESIYLNGKGYTVTAIGDKAFYYCHNLTMVTIPNSVITIGDEAFRHCDNLTQVTIPNSVTHIGEWVFCSSGLTSVNIPSSITTLPYSIFNGCGKLTSVIIPDNITSIEGKAFYRCKGLTSVTIGNNVRSIGDWSFGECLNLSSVNIPNSVTSIGLSAFNGCNKLNYITSEIQNPFAIDIIDFCTYYTATLIVPKGTISAYLSTEGWKNFLNIIDNPSAPVIDSPIVINSPIIGKWALDPGKSYRYKNMEFKSDGTFIYTDSEQQAEETGNYIISGDVLCRKMGYEEVWFKSKIWRLDAISMVFQDYADMDNSLKKDIYVYFNENPKPAKDPNPLLIGIWDYMWSSPFKSFILTNAEFNADGTFYYTSVNDLDYKDYGVYRVEGDMLYEMYDNEGDWEMSKIKTLESNYLVIAEIASDGLSEKRELFFHRNNSGESNTTLTGAWLGCTVSDRHNRFEQWTFNDDRTGSMTIWEEEKDNMSSVPFTYTVTESSITIDWSDRVPETYQYTIYGSTLTLVKGNKSMLYYKQGGETGIRSVSSENEIDCIYSLRGVKIKNPSKGINIIKMKDGTVKKVFVK